MSVGSESSPGTQDVIVVDAHVQRLVHAAAWKPPVVVRSCEFSNELSWLKRLLPRAVAQLSKGLSPDVRWGLAASFSPRQSFHRMVDWAHEPPHDQAPRLHPWRFLIPQDCTTERNLGQLPWHSSFSRTFAHIFVAGPRACLLGVALADPFLAVPRVVSANDHDYGGGQRGKHKWPHKRVVVSQAGCYYLPNQEAYTRPCVREGHVCARAMCAMRWRPYFKARFVQLPG